MIIKINFDLIEENNDKAKTHKDRVKELLEEVGNCLDAPYYASKLIMSNGSEILDIVEHLEKEIELLKRR